MELELTRLFKDLRKEASKLEKSYEKYSIDFLANTYIKAQEDQDESLKSIYFSALILRYWYVINKTYQKVKTCGYDYKDCFDNLCDCITVACKYKAWQSTSYNADQCIKKVIGTRGAPALIQKANLHKYNNRAVISLDDTKEEEDDNRSFADSRAFDQSYQLELDTKNYELIKYFLEENKDITSAILIDLITNSDCFTESSQTFSLYKLIAAIQTLDTDYAKYFSKVYDADVKKVITVLNRLTTIKLKADFNDFFDKYKLTIGKALIAWGVK